MNGLTMRKINLRR